MRAQIEKWGNDLTIRIPEELIQNAGLSEDMMVEIYFEKGNVTLKPTTKYTLEELTAQISDENIHTRIDFGRPRGKEV